MDADSDSVTNVYRWYKNNIVQLSLENFSVVMAGNLSAFDVWVCEVQPYDIEAGVAKNSSSLTVLDKIAPVPIPGANPVNDFNSSSPTISFDLSCSDNVAPQYLELWGNWTGIWAKSKQNASATNATTWTINVSLIMEAQGLIWGVWCNDTSGNSNWSSVNRTFNIDLTGPYFVDITTSSGTNQQTWIEANVTAFDINRDSVTIFLYNSSRELIFKDIGSGNNNEANFTSLPHGFYFLNATANDTAGNINATDTIPIELNFAPSKPNITVPDNSTYSPFCPQQTPKTIPYPTTSAFFGLIFP